jgi:hypothetical protein
VVAPLADLSVSASLRRNRAKARGEGGEIYATTPFENHYGSQTLKPLKCVCPFPPSNFTGNLPLRKTQTGQFQCSMFDVGINFPLRSHRKLAPTAAHGVVNQMLELQRLWIDNAGFHPLRLSFFAIFVFFCGYRLRRVVGRHAVPRYFIYENYRS